MGRTKRVGVVVSAGVGGVFAGIVLAVVALVGIAGIVLWVTHESSTERALKGVRQMIPRGSPVRARSCRLVISDADDDVFRCLIDAPKCERSYLFAIPKNASIEVVEPYAVAITALSKPCAFPSDHRLRAERPA